MSRPSNQSTAVAAVCFLCNGKRAGAISANSCVHHVYHDECLAPIAGAQLIFVEGCRVCAEIDHKRILQQFMAKYKAEASTLNACSMRPLLSADASLLLSYNAAIGENPNGEAPAATPAELEVAKEEGAVCVVCCKNDHDATTAWASCTGSCQGTGIGHAPSSLPADWTCPECRIKLLEQTRTDELDSGHVDKGEDGRASRDEQPGKSATPPPTPRPARVAVVPSALTPAVSAPAEHTPVHRNSLEVPATPTIGLPRCTAKLGRGTECGRTLRKDGTCQYSSHNQPALAPPARLNDSQSGLLCLPAWTLSDAVVYGTGDAFYYQGALVSVVDRLLLELVVELNMLYVPRSNLPRPVDGKKIQQPPDVAFLSDGEEYEHTHGDQITTHRWTATTRLVRDWLEAAMGIHFTHLVVSRDQISPDHIPLHYDGSSDAEGGWPVCMVSLGDAWFFRLKEVDGEKVKSFPMQAGDVFLLGPQTNIAWKLGIVQTQTQTPAGMRIILTYRAVKRRPMPALGALSAAASAAKPTSTEEEEKLAIAPRRNERLCNRAITITTAHRAAASSPAQSRTSVQAPASPSLPLSLSYDPDHPVLRWPGGKQQVMKLIINNGWMPKEVHGDVKDITCGGLSMLIGVILASQLGRIAVHGHFYASDVNPRLVRTYIVIKEHVGVVERELASLLGDYHKLDWEGRGAFYDRLRDEYNSTDVRQGRLTVPQKGRLAAALLYLNSVSINHLYRESSNGYNAAWRGRGKVGETQNTDSQVNIEQLRTLSRLLRDEDVQFECQSLEKTPYNDKDVLLIDPPYASDADGKSHFVEYYRDGGDWKMGRDSNMHNETAALCKRLTCRFVQCNAACGWIDEQYADRRFTVHDHVVRRSVNPKVGGGAGEVVICNFSC